MREEHVRDFLTELTRLTRKYGLLIKESCSDEPMYVVELPVDKSEYVYRVSTINNMELGFTPSTGQNWDEWIQETYIYAKYDVLHEEWNKSLANKKWWAEYKVKNRESFGCWINDGSAHGKIYCMECGEKRGLKAECHYDGDDWICCECGRSISRLYDVARSRGEPWAL